MTPFMGAEMKCNSLGLKPKQAACFLSAGKAKPVSGVARLFGRVVYICRRTLTTRKTKRRAKESVFAYGRRLGRLGCGRFSNKDQPSSLSRLASLNPSKYLRRRRVF